MPFLLWSVLEKKKKGGGGVKKGKKKKKNTNKNKSGLFLPNIHYTYAVMLSTMSPYVVFPPGLQHEQVWGEVVPLLSPSCNRKVTEL